MNKISNKYTLKVDGFFYYLYIVCNKHVRYKANAMGITEILNYSITLSAIIASIVAWLAKIRWSKEFKDAKEAEIKAKTSERDAVNAKAELYKAVVSEKLLEHSKQTIAELEKMIDETKKNGEKEKEKTKEAQEKIKNILTELKEREKAFKSKHFNNNMPLSVISIHELRTPINAILGFMTLLKDPDVSSTERNEYIDLIHYSSRDLLTILDKASDLENSQRKFLEL